MRLAFVDGTQTAGLETAAIQGRLDGFPRMLGGAAAVDVDDDLDVDLLLVYPGATGVMLFENQGTGSFANVTSLKIDQPQIVHGAGALFFDGDGDDDLDLLVTAHAEEGARYFRQEEGVWQRTALPGLETIRYAVSPTVADINRDGWLDLFVTHWNLSLAHALERNPNSDLVFFLFGNAGGFYAPENQVGLDEAALPFSFTGHFTDLDDDGFPDLLVASDFGQSRIFQNENGTFFRKMNVTLTDDNGMGAVLFDFDNDGDEDWFVTSISTPEEFADSPEAKRYTGNRLYQNQGDGDFVEVSATAFVRDGGWGWGACAADFDNDGWLDLFHTNGFEPYESPLLEFRADSARLFLNLRDGRFVDVASDVGLVDDDQGRAVVCFDHDNDGDVDIVVMNYRSPPRLWRNDAPSGNQYLQVSLRGRAPNTRAVGARVTIQTGSRVQTRVVHGGNTYLGQQPYRLHFGLGAYTRVQQLQVQWPDGSVTTLHDVSSNQHLVLQP